MHILFLYSTFSGSLPGSLERRAVIFALGYSFEKVLIAGMLNPAGSSPPRQIKIVEKSDGVFLKSFLLFDLSIKLESKLFAFLLSSNGGIISNK